MSTEQNVQTAKQFLAAATGYDVERAMSLMSDDATYWVAGKPHLFPFAGQKSRAEFRTLLGGPNPFKNGMSMKVHRAIAQGDDVALETESYGVTENGLTYNNNYVFLFSFRDGKIVSAKEYTDPQHSAEIFLA